MLITDLKDRVTARRELIHVRLSNRAILLCDSDDHRRVNGHIEDASWMIIVMVNIMIIILIMMTV